MASSGVRGTDGDEFINYVFPGTTGMPTCSAAKSDWTVLTYNFAFLYQAERDADGDGIMCEELPEDQVIVGDDNLIPR